MIKKCCGACDYWFAGRCKFHEVNTDVLSSCSNFKMWRGYK